MSEVETVHPILTVATSAEIQGLTSGFLQTFAGQSQLHSSHSALTAPQSYVLAVQH